MYRKIEKELLKWKENHKKPLMLIGARQTGKTYIIEEFCKKNYDSYLYFNLEKESDILSIFETTIIPEEIIEKIEIIKNKKINLENTIIFFDEIQVSEQAITSLKYFCESQIDYKIICAGSLLGVKLNRFHSSFPVGKVNFKYLYPLDFEEFLIGIGETKLIEEIKKHYKTNEKLLNPIHEKAIDLYKKYLILGGMPEVVQEFIDKNYKIQDVNLSLQEDIIMSYLADMSKYTEKNESIKNIKIYNSIPKELSKENKTFKFSLVDENARKSRYETSLEWLKASFMIIRCNLITKNESPFIAYTNEEKFKLYLSDTGLLRSLSNINYTEILMEKNMMYKGVLTENYVACEFFSKFKEINYYTFNKYEIDFIIKLNDDIIPVEVKSGNRTKHTSLNEYIKKYSPKYSILISEKNFGFENNIKSVPLYAVFCINNDKENII